MFVAVVSFKVPFISSLFFFPLGAADIRPKALPMPASALPPGHTSSSVSWLLSFMQ